MFGLRPISHVLYSCVLLLPSLVVAGSAMPAAGQRHAPKHAKPAKEQIQDLEEQWRTATVAGDATTMDRLLADDYVGISWTGQVNTKAMQLDRTRTRTVVVSQMELTDTKIKIVGPVAIVTTRASIKGTSDGADITGEFRYTRVYQRVAPGGWRITNFESTRIPTGQRGDHMRRPPPPPPS